MSDRRIPRRSILCAAAAIPLASLLPRRLGAETAEAGPEGASPQVPKATAGEHPLVEPLRLARDALRRADSLDTYSYTFVKRERIDGELSDHEHLFMKVRNRPFSVYVYALGPEKPRGEEAIYVEGANDGQVVAHTTGVRDRIVGAVRLDPEHRRLMDGNRYPVTSAGLSNLLRKVIALHEPETAFGECDVQYFDDAKVDGRPTLCVQVVHPVRRTNFRTHATRIFYDKQLGLPVRWEAYTWPDAAGDKPTLVEEYTFRDLNVDRQYGDVDFDPANPSYSFQ